MANNWSSSYSTLTQIISASIYIYINLYPNVIMYIIRTNVYGYDII